MSARGLIESERRYAEDVGRLTRDLDSAKAKSAKLECERKDVWWSGFGAGVLWCVGAVVFWGFTRVFWIDIGWRGFIWLWH